MAEIIPAIMPQSTDDLEYKLAQVAAHVSYVQLDIMDGKFVRAKTWPYMNDKGSFDALLTESEGLPFWDKVNFEIDLMVAKPEEVVDEWIIAGASRIIVHVESTQAIQDIIPLCRDRAELVLALNVETSMDTILPYLEDIQGIQFMGIATIGIQGEPFDERVLDKIREFHNAHPEVMLSVDGGVTLDNAHMLVEAGVQRLVSGSAIFESGVIGDTIHAFKEL